MGSLLVCNWLHFVRQNHLYVMMLIIQGCCFIQSLHFSFWASRRLCADFKAVSSISLQPSGWHVISSGRSTVEVSFVRTTRTFRPDLPLCQEASNYSNLHPSGRFRSTSGRHSVFDQLWDFFPKHRYGKIATTVRTMCIPVWKCSFIRQVMHSKFNRPNEVFMVQTLKLHIWKLRVSNQPFERHLLWSRCAKPWYGNCVQIKCDRSDAALFRKEFLRNLESRSHSYRSGRLMSTVWTTPRYFKSDAHLNL
jgi:hypothetical protein